MYRVVIADDEPLIRMDIREILEINGYEVVGEAADGFDAVELCRRLRPDLGLLDVKMPLMGGLKAAEIIGHEIPETCVVMLTAYSDRDTVSKAVSAEVMGYLVKPVDENALLPAIEVALHKQLQLSQKSAECESIKNALESRKLIDRAKGYLMDTENMSELSAYQYMRKVAMDKGCTIAEIARVILSNR